MTATTAHCRHCGAAFTASRSGSTVHCPAHRTAASRKADARSSRKVACIVCGDDARGVPSTSAVTGAVSWTPCWGSAHRR